MRRPLVLLGAAVLCAGAGVASWLSHRGAPTAPPKPSVPPSIKPAAIHDPGAVSAPAPEVTPPVSQETAKAMQTILAAHPAVQARERALDEKAARGDAVVPEIVKACIERPQDDVVIVEAVQVLSRIDTPKARETLSALTKTNAIAATAWEEMKR